MSSIKFWLALLTPRQPEEDVQLYDEVDEDDYKRIVKGRLQKDDFIEDDGVDGYADNGMDDWGDGDQYVSEEEAKPKKGESNNLHFDVMCILTAIQQARR